MRALRPGRWASGPHHTAHSSTSPANEVHCASVPSGMASCGIDGDSLAPVAGTAVATWSTNSQVGLDLVEPEDPLDPPVPPGAPGHPARRVEPHPDPRAQRVAGRLELLGQTHPGPRVRPGPQVDVGDRRGDGVDVDAAHRDAERRHRHGIGADAAAEVVHGRQRGVVEPPGVGRRDLEPGGLLEPVGGVEQVVGELAELGDRPGPQPLLGEQGGDEVGVVALLAQPVAAGASPRARRTRAGLEDRPTVG